MISRISGTKTVGRFCASLSLLIALLCFTACGEKTPEEKLQEATQLLQEGQTPRAVLKLKQLVQDHPEDPSATDAHLILAQYYVREGTASRALEHLDEVISLSEPGDPRYSEALRGSLAIYSQTGEHEKAVGLIDKEMERIPEGQDEFRQSLKLEKSTVMLQSGDDSLTTSGIEIIRGMMLESEDPRVRGFARENFANFYRTRGEFLQSNEVYREYLETYPDEVVRTEIEMAMAINRYKAGETEEALEDFANAVVDYEAAMDEELEQQRKNQMIQALASMYTEIEQYDKAEEMLRQLMAENTMSQAAINAQFGIARLYLVAGLQQQNEEYFEKGAATLEQIMRENPDTNIATTAESQLTQAKQVWQQITQPEQQPVIDDEATTPAVETTP